MMNMEISPIKRSMAQAPLLTDFVAVSLQNFFLK